MKINLANIRQEYTKGGLKANDLPEDPITLFEKWLNDAIEAKTEEPTAVIVGTVSPEGTPSTRTVLLKALREGQFVFYTNYESRKGSHLAQNPHISLSFVWHELERQVHIEGIAAKVSPEESDAYFKTRPYKSRIGARISPQSRPVGSRVEIMRLFVAEAARWIGREVERPDNWGGYEVTPTRIEFWQGRPSRLHDRFLYILQEDKQNWKRERLAP
ncbi:pyridoxamine 5'-phosphate oxidase [uncultured Bacteroides sp.]|uniref:pyridoxamine 5'-phosphate oxidase n=1 Tax=uncultured Bacteroides sp. TaxID=162156 RepID=UPI002AA5F242|nr:pyridoxamine 5'-phosphate oxidase [uncultured Bacteroides sp.]